MYQIYYSVSRLCLEYIYAVFNLYMYYIETTVQFCVNYSYNMQILCKPLYITEQDPLYSAVHPMKYLESDVMR